MIYSGDQTDDSCGDWTSRGKGALPVTRAGKAAIRSSGGSRSY